MRAMVLGAGLGTRLRPLTLERPKPAVPVGNRPLAWFSLSHLARAGVTRVVMNTHHLGEALPGWLAPHLPEGLHVTYVHESPRVLGTGGGLKNAETLLFEEGGDPDAPVIVMNADIVFAPDLAAALALHARLDAVATMVVRRDPDARRYGAVEVDGEGRVRRLLGAPEAPRGAALTETMFTGVHVLSRRAFRDLPADGCVIRSAYRKWMDGEETVAAHLERAPWRDLGTHAAYMAANLDLAGGRLAWPGIEPGKGGSLVHPEARIGEGARIDGSVIGQGATVAPGVHIARSVLWDGARCEVALQDAVLTQDGVLVSL